MYKIIVSSALEGLEEKVLAQLDKGYKLQGGLSTFNIGFRTPEAKYMQAMYKAPEESLRATARGGKTK